jgi:hypothetical protein
MKQIQSVVSGLVVCGVVLAMTSSLSAQTAAQREARVLKITGAARATSGNQQWRTLHAGDKLPAGTTIQTAAGSTVDLALDAGGGSSPGTRAIARPTSGEVSSYSSSTERDVVRISENSVMAIDKLTAMDTGAGEVTETQLDLQRGKIFGRVKKLAPASRYEVKIPNGVAGIRGTVYEISADGVVKVYVGSIVIAYVAPDGTVVTQVISAGQQFDGRTQQIIAIPQAEINGALGAAVYGEARITEFVVDHTIYYVSPVSGSASNGGGGGDGGDGEGSGGGE